MLTKEQDEEARIKALEYYKRAGIIVSEEEKKRIEVVDFGLGELEQTGVQILVYVSTSRYCVKEMVLFPKQTCPEHKHPPFGENPGKQETFRCRWGKLYLYVLGGKTSEIYCSPPRKECYTVWHEVVLNPGDQYTVLPNTLHWFQAGSEGVVLSEFSSKNRDEYDEFTDPRVRREIVVR